MCEACMVGAELLIAASVGFEASSSCGRSALDMPGAQAAAAFQSASQTAPDAISRATGVSRAPSHGPQTQKPSSARNRAPWVEQTRKFPLRSRNLSGKVSSGVP